MKPIVYVSAIIGLILGGSITFGVIRWLDKGSPELAFVVGAVLGIQLAVIAHHRHPGASSSSRVKARVGAALAVSTILFGVALHFGWKAFEYPEISIPIAVVGTFFFPFVLLDTMWNALAKPPGR